MKAMRAYVFPFGISVFVLNAGGVPGQTVALLCLRLWLIDTLPLHALQLNTSWHHASPVGSMANVTQKSQFQQTHFSKANVIVIGGFSGMCRKPTGKKTRHQEKQECEAAGRNTLTPHGWVVRNFVSLWHAGEARWVWHYSPLARAHTSSATAEQWTQMAT